MDWTELCWHSNCATRTLPLPGLNQPQCCIRAIPCSKGVGCVSQELLCKAGKKLLRTETEQALETRREQRLWGTLVRGQVLLGSQNKDFSGGGEHQSKGAYLIFIPPNKSWRRGCVCDCPRACFAFFWGGRVWGKLKGPCSSSLSWGNLRGSGKYHFLSLPEISLSPLPPQALARLPVYGAKCWVVLSSRNLPWNGVVFEMPWERIAGGKGSCCLAHFDTSNSFLKGATCVWSLLGL